MSDRNRAATRGLLALLAALAGLPPAAGQEPQEPPVFGEVVVVRTGFVRLTLPADAPPPRAEEIEVLWKRRPQRVVRVVGGGDAPLELGVAVDRSASFHEAFAALRAAALDVVERSLDEHDRLFALAFTDEARLLGEGRGEAARVLAALATDPEPGQHPTALFDTIDRALRMFGNADARAALIVATDGCDTSGELSRSGPVARRARELAIPVFLLLPDRDDCEFTRCEPDGAGGWTCTADSAPTIYRGSSPTMFNPAGGQVSMMAEDRASGATAERERFSAAIADAGGGAFVVKDPEDWQRALRRIFDRLERQWTVVFEPSSSEVVSDEVRVYSRAGGHRRRLH